MLNNRALDLKNVWIVFKRMKKTNWYHRGPNYQVCSTRAHQAVKFTDKAEADAFATKLNAGRKSYRFKVETASKHFVNNWAIGYDIYQKQVVINSTPIGIDRLAKLQSYESYRPSLDAQKSKVIDTLNTYIAQGETEIKDRDSQLTIELQRALASYNSTVEYINKNHTERRLKSLEQQSKLVGMKTALEQKNLDEEYVEVLGTEMDKKAAILFGNKNAT